MRIESVTIKNINSLSGTFDIDFTDNRYSEGLFAITGPSGAGKTTVLDAICLALYGKTPRIDTISETQDEIMNKNSGDCLAEAVFTSRGKRYKSAFSHQRGKGEKPFRPVKREIHEYNSDGTWSMIASAIKEANDKIVQITGLTYSQFTRSIMLAQFQFAEFLKADSNERAAILEQISDMDIYRDISAAVYERAKSEKEALSDIKLRMQALKVLDEAQLQVLEEEERRIFGAVTTHSALRDKFALLRDTDIEINKLRKELDGYKEYTAPLAQALAADAKAFGQAEAGEKEAKQSLLELQKILKSVRELDNKTVAQSGEIKRLNGEAIAAGDKIKARKKELVALFLKYFPNARGDELKSLYESADAGEKMRAGAKASLGEASAIQQAAQSEHKKNLQGRDEAYWQARVDALRITLAIAQAGEAARQANEKLAASRKNEKEIVSGLEKLEAEEKTAEDRLVYARLEQRFGDERRKLEEGKPCPLCGSTIHPDAGKAHDAEFLAEAQKSRDDISRRIKAAHQELAATRKQMADLEALIDEKNGVIEQKGEELAHFGEEYAAYSGAAEDIEKKLAEAERAIRANTALLGKLNEAAQNVLKQTEKMGEADRDAVAVENAKRIIEDIERQTDALNKSGSEAEKVLNTLKAQRTVLFGDKDPDAEEAKAAQAAEDAQKRKEEWRSMKERAERAVEQNKKDIARTQESLRAKAESLEKEYLEARSKALSACEAPCSDEEVIAVLFDEFRNTAARLGESAAESADRFDALARILGELVSKQTARRGAVGQMLADNAKSMKEIGELKKSEKKQVLVCARWDRLNALIGSADGIKFSRMAQGYTFEALLRYANNCLKRMTDRYILVRDTANGSKPLELAVADNYQAGDRRPVSNLSGGESFLVSMALALGMSEMSSGKTRIDSLFIDEGFASLDDDYLEAALQTLSSLGNREGKLVGVISHVGALKERIDAQIEVKKLSGGRSTLIGPGVKAAGT